MRYVSWSDEGIESKFLGLINPTNPSRKIFSPCAIFVEMNSPPHFTPQNASPQPRDFGTASFPLTSMGLGALLTPACDRPELSTSFNVRTLKLSLSHVGRSKNSRMISFPLSLGLPMPIGVHGGVA